MAILIQSHLIGGASYMQNNTDKANKNQFTLLLIVMAAIVLLLALFFGIRPMWSNSSTPEKNMEQQSNLNQDTNSNDTTRENVTSNTNSTPNNPKENNTTTHSSNSYDNVTALEINTFNSSLVIKQGNTDKVQVEYNNVPSDYITKLENDGTLHLKGNKSSDTLIITLPKNLTLQECDINGGTGVINITDLITNNFDLDCGSGNVSLSNISLHDADIECNTGLVDIFGRLSGETDIQCNKGSLSLRLTDYNDNYNMKVKKGTGELIVNGETHDSFALIPSAQSPANCHLEIEGSSGNINIDF